MNLALYSDNQNSVVATPNPVTTAAANLAGTAVPTIVPLFIQTSLGPNGTAGTMVTDIDSGLQVTQKVGIGVFSCLRRLTRPTFLQSAWQIQP